MFKSRIYKPCDLCVPTNVRLRSLFVKFYLLQLDTFKYIIVLHRSLHFILFLKNTPYLIKKKKKRELYPNPYRAPHLDNKYIQEPCHFLVYETKQYTINFGDHFWNILCTAQQATALYITSFEALCSFLSIGHARRENHAKYKPKIAKKYVEKYHHEPF